VLLGLDYRGERVGAVALAMQKEGMTVGMVREAAQNTLRLTVPRFVAALAADEIRAVSITDPLTGLHNRRGLDGELARVGSRGGALVACDLDRFKKLNDSLGHAAGDAALVHFSAILKVEVRGSDTAARVGGEEFHIWAPGATVARGAEIAERIRVALAGSQWSWQGTPWVLTASFGVAGVPETSASVHNLSVQADAALYVAKERGRNRVEVAPGG
jgi:diguanylate cyclase (GGDEF)-like protein